MGIESERIKILKAIKDQKKRKKTSQKVEMRMTKPVRYLNNKTK